MIKGILFDLDGTLLYTLKDLQNATNHVLLAYGKKKVTIKQTKTYIGNGVRKLLERSFGEPIDDEKYEMFKNYYAKHNTDYTKPYVGIIKLLKKLKRENLKISIVSNKYQDGVDNICRPLFKELIDVYIGSSLTMKLKPNTDMIEKALNDMELKRDECIYVGDSEVDCLTASNANVKMIACLWGYRKKKSLKNYKIDYFVNNPKQIYQIIKKENKND